MFTHKQITGYLKAKQRRSSIGGGTTCNDNYNKEMFGITDAEYQAMNRRINDAFGLIPPTTAHLKRSLQGEYVTR